MIGSADQMLRPRVRFGKRENSLQCIVKRDGTSELKNLVPRSPSKAPLPSPGPGKFFKAGAAFWMTIRARFDLETLLLLATWLCHACLFVTRASQNKTTNRDSTDRGGKYLPQAFIEHNHGPCFGAERFRLATPFFSLALMDILAYGFAI